MPAYTATNWVHGSTAVNQTNMNKIETQLAAVQYGINTISPYTLVSNDTVNSGVTDTWTCTGVGGIPSGAKQVQLSYYYTSNAINTFISFTPQGTAWSNGNYPASNPVATGSAIGNAGSYLVPIASNGQLDIKAHNGNVTGLYVNLTGYVY